MTPQPQIPRFQARRRTIRWLSHTAFNLLCDFHIENSERLPAKGPLIVVGNHFHFADPATFVSVLPWHTEYIAGTERPSAPWIAKKLPELWTTINVKRGNATTDALRRATNVLNQGGILGVFPEAGAWARVLRPARPGVAFLAATTGAPLLPIGIDGMHEIFASLRAGKRARVTLNVGRPFGPFNVTSKGRQRRAELDEIGHTIMKQIAGLIPPEKRGLYADDPALREAAKAVADYPWD